jgi:hypothetical protein
MCVEHTEVDYREVGGVKKTRSRHEFPLPANLEKICGMVDEYNPATGVLIEKKSVNRRKGARVRKEDIEFVAFKKDCIDFNGEFNCPKCKALLIPVCVNLGMADGKFYCVRNFPDDCSKFGCPKLIYVYWEELVKYRLYGKRQEQV